MEQAVHLIRELLEKGYAYRYKADIFFDPLKFEGFGKLFRLDMSKWPKTKKRFKQDTYPGRRWNLGDFILWHGCKNRDKVCWDTEIGKGRPSWNIQDPAMISETLGYSLDIFCGGIDNLYRHHDYNIAVMESVSGEELCALLAARRARSGRRKENVEEPPQYCLSRKISSIRVFPGSKSAFI